MKSEVLFLALKTRGRPGWGRRLTGPASTPQSEPDLQVSQVPGGSSPPPSDCL